MKYQKALSALHEYISNFDPEEFSSPPDFTPSQVLSVEQRAEIQKLKARLKRKRLLLESIHALHDRDVQSQTEIIITQEEVDALLEGWSDSEGSK
ncbi:MAG: hypothetical protein KKD63_12780 [Proteobacteria bacterium]|nr:hypothetical protein [Desulfobulbaceae bacterium]MBU4153744.1 hypothetical protein [Pseudomonadota bacterium]MDP2106221.1 hypothetical protein [Desulfobulbaceae bacterium]